MSSVDIVVPGDIATLTGGYIYDRHIAEGLASLGWQVNVHSLDPSFPVPKRSAVHEAMELFESIPDGRMVVIDGLAIGGLVGILQTHAERLKLVALVHHPVAFEIGLYAARAKSLHQSEKESLAIVDRVVCTSAWTSRALADYDVPAELIRVVEPGTTQAPVAKGSSSGELNLLCVATITPRKGHAVLLDALERLRNRRWHLHCVGSLDRNRDCAYALRNQIEDLRLTDRVTLHGEVPNEERDRLYSEADIFVLASNLEGYGMALAEALARGIPIVTTPSGAIPETVPEDAGVFVPAGDSAALAAALDELIGNPRTRKTVAERALAVRENLPTWDDACEGFARVLEELEAA